MGNTAIYQSSAGSGKTFTLVKNYLKILLGVSGRFDTSIYKNVLCITFTNKATNEMKSRILKELASIASGENTLMLSVLEEELKPNYDLAKQAKLIHNLILQDLGNLQITTIDSFFQQIIRSFAKELALPFNYNIEMDTNMILQQITANLYLQIENNPQLNSWMKQFTFHQINENKNWDIERNLIAFGKQLFYDDFQVLKDTLPSIQHLKATSKRLYQVKSKFEESLKKLVSEIIEQLPKKIDKTNFAYKGEFINYLERIANGLVTPPGIRLSKYLSGSIPLYNKKCDEHIKIEIDNFYENVKGNFNEVTNLFEKPFIRYNSCKVVLSNIYSLGLLTYLNKELAKYRAENDTLLISDTNQLMHLLIKNDDNPFIYERAGTFFKYVLIDEFQDTSNLQWENILPLLLQLLSQAQSHELKVILVGDVKQSIYRWRGGNMNLLLQNAINDLSISDIAIKQLNTNYRSRKEIVTFNNLFFSNLTEIVNVDHLQQLYNKVEQKSIVKDKNEGYIEFQFFEDEKEHDWKSKATTKLINDIKELTSTYNYKKQDIAILTRKNAEAENLAKTLERHQIDVVSAEGLLLKNQVNIQFLLSCFRFLVDTNDEISKSELAFHLYKLGKLNVRSIHHIFDKEKSPILLNENFPDFFEQIGYLQVINVLDATQKLKSIFDIDIDDYLLEFESQVLNFVNNKSGTISDFLEWWDLTGHKNSILGSNHEDAVQIITIHKSKGLEFPIVIIPYADWSVKPKPMGILWAATDQPPFDVHFPYPLKISSQLENTFFKDAYDKEIYNCLIDNINLLYVAFTRASEQLLISAPFKKSKSKSYSLTSQLTIDALKKMSPDTEKDLFFASGYKSKKENTNNSNNPLNNKSITAGFAKSKSFSLSSKGHSKSDETTLVGLAVHEILFKINHKKNYKKITLQYLSAKGYSLKLKNKIQLSIDKIFEIDQLENWFSGRWEAYNEREIHYKGAIIRPDKVIVNKDKQCIVIDYKTGSVSKKHKDQVAIYIDALSSIGYRAVEGYLLYSSLPSLIKV